MTTHEQRLREMADYYKDDMLTALDLDALGWALQEIDRLRGLLAFNRFRYSEHKPSYAAVCLEEGRISLAKFCEYVHHLSEGVEDPIIQGVHRTLSEDERTRAELVEEIERLRTTPTSEILPEADRGAHTYVSTACHHGLHDRCRQTCKFCDRKCNCACHR